MPVPRQYPTQRALGRLPSPRLPSPHLHTARCHLPCTPAKPLQTELEGKAGDSPLPKPQVCSCGMTEWITEGPSNLKGMSLRTCFQGKNKPTYEMYTKSLQAVYNQPGVFCPVCIFAKNLNMKTPKWNSIQIIYNLLSLCISYSLSILLISSPTYYYWSSKFPVCLEFLII